MVTGKHLLVLLSLQWFFLSWSKAPELDPTLYTGKERSFTKRNPDPTCHWQSPKNYFVLLQNPMELITWSLVCNSLSSYISVSSDTDTRVIFSFSVPLQTSPHRPDTIARRQYKFTDEILKTKTCWRNSWFQISSMGYLNGALFA